MQKKDEIMKNCKTCKWWRNTQGDWRGFDVRLPIDPATDDPCETEEDVVKVFGYAVRRCENPRIRFYEFPDRNGCALVDGSEYHAHLETAEYFGCVLHEEENHA